jgi:hypothetical protein
MQLMGHSDIETTMVYVQISRQDVWRQHVQAVQNRIPSLPCLPEEEIHAGLYGRRDGSLFFPSAARRSSNAKA